MACHARGALPEAELRDLALEYGYRLQARAQMLFQLAGLDVSAIDGGAAEMQAKEGKTESNEREAEPEEKDGFPPLDADDPSIQSFMTEINPNPEAEDS